MEKIEIVHLILDTLLELLPETDARKKNISNDFITYVADRKGHDKRYAICPDKIKNQIDWEPETKFSDGIKKTISWYWEHENWLSHVTDKSYQVYYATMYGKKE